MSQQRLFEFEAPDSTFDINSRFVSIAPSGLHAGFDVVLGGTMDLELNHLTTGKEYVNQDLTLTPKQGLVITRQGVEVRVSNAITLPIAPTTVQGRRDAVILSHSYQSIAGGVAATISVLQDIGVGEPLLSTNQVLLGILELPQNCTALNQSGVIYDRRQVPNITDLSNLVAPLQSQINAKIPLAQKAQANGVATLDGSGKVPLNQLPIEVSGTKILDNISQRDSEIVFVGKKVHVIDASDDADVESGYAGYIWNGSDWLRTYDEETKQIKADKNQGVFTAYTTLENNWAFTTGYAQSIRARITQWGERQIKSFSVTRTSGTVINTSDIFTLPSGFENSEKITIAVLTNSISRQRVEVVMVNIHNNKIQLEKTDGLQEVGQGDIIYIPELRY